MFNLEHATGRVSCIIRESRDYLMYSSIYLSIAAAAMACISCTLQGIEILPICAGIMFFVTYSIYNMNRKTDENEDVINHAARYSFTKKYEHPLLCSAICAYGFAVILAAGCGVTTLLVTIIPLVCGIAYSIPLLPHGNRYRRFKEIPAVKNLVVSIAWALPPALLPGYVSGSNPGVMAGITGLLFFTLVFINTTVFDMRDIRGDSLAGVRTIPVILGVKKTKILLTVANLVLGMVVILISMKIIPRAETIVLVFGVIYAQGYIVLFQEVATKNVLCDLIADGQFIVFGGLLYFFMYFFP